MHFSASLILVVKTDLCVINESIPVYNQCVHVFIIIFDYFYILVSDHSIKKVDREMKEASGRMKVGRFVLHGAPQSGKSSAGDLLVNKPPVKKESTRLVEDPVKAVSTTSVKLAIVDQIVSHMFGCASVIVCRS